MPLEADRSFDVAAAEERRRTRIPAWVAVAARPLAIYGGSRLVVLGAMWLASRIPPTRSLSDMVTFWDSGWYLMTAQSGYPHALPLVDGHVGQSTLAFFPLFPLCIRVFHALGLSYLAAGLLVAGLAGAIATVLMWLLLAKLWGGEVADRGVALFCFFPGAFVLAGVYPEPLMLALAIGCLLALGSHRWVLAGILATLATATSSHALAVAPACAWAALTAIRERREWRALAAPILAPFGFVGFYIFLWGRTGSPNAYLRIEEGWGVKLDLLDPWHKFRDFFQRPLEDVNITLAVAGTLFLVVTLTMLIRTRPPGPIVVYAVFVMLPVMVYETLGARPRFLLTAFPLIAVLGHRFRNNAFAGVLAASATLLGCLTVVTVKTLMATP